MGTKMPAGRWLLFLVAVAGAARAGDEPVMVERPAQAEGRAVQAWTSLQLKQGEPRDAVQQLVKSLGAVDLNASATLALVHLGDPSRTGDARIRAAARAELMERAEAQDALASSLLLDLQLEPQEIAAHPALAVTIARGHLERALLDKPLVEGGSFEAGEAPEPAPGQPLNAAANVSPQRSHRAVASLAEARRIAAAVPAKGEHVAEAREVAGLAALAAGDELSAEKEFSSLAGEESRGQKALLQLARLAYARGDDRRAEIMYSRVGRGSPEWLDALFEASWTYFRRGEDERVLGNLLTLQAPFFHGREFPEAYVLQALVLYENCRYQDARRALGRLESTFRPKHDAITAALGAVEALPQPFDALGPERARAAAGLNAAGKAELERVAVSADLQALRAAVLRLGAELDSFDRRGDTIRGSAFARAVVPQVRAVRLQMLTQAGDRLRARLAADRAELRELLGQSLRLSYEISGREKDQAAQETARAKARSDKPADIDDDEVMWPFQGEYWRDELGSYRFTLGTRCVPAPRFKAKPTSATLEK
jgi:hypothetical protein